MHKQSRNQHRYGWLVIGLLLCVVAIRLPFAWIPYQSGDEGNYLCHGMAIAEDGAVYGTDFIDGRGPLGFFFYAFCIALFGYDTTLWIHLVAVVWHAGITLFVVLIGRQLFGARTSLYAGLFYSVFSFANNLTDNLCLNVEQLALLPLLLSLWIFFSCYSKGQNDNMISRSLSKGTLLRFLLCGILLGITFSIRQPMAIVLPMFCGLQFLSNNSGNNHLHFSLNKWWAACIICLGFLVGLVLGYFHPIITGQLKNAIYCSIIHGFTHPVITWLGRLRNFCGRYLIFIFYQPLLWVGILFVFAKCGQMLRQQGLLFLFNPLAITAFMFFLQAFGILVMGRIAMHSFFALFPLSALLLAVGFSNLWFPRGCEKSLVLIKWFILAVGCAVPLGHFLLFPVGAIMGEYSIREYWTESLNKNMNVFRAANYIKDNTSSDTRIFCLSCSHANRRFYFMAQRLPATEPYDGDFHKPSRLKQMLDQMGGDTMLVLFSPSLFGLETVGDKDIKQFLGDHGYFCTKRFENQEHTRFFYCKRLEQESEWVEIWQLLPEDKQTKTKEDIANGNE